MHEPSSLAQTRLIGVGDHLPHLSLPDLDGAPFGLGSLHGKRTLLFMWGSW